MLSRFLVVALVCSIAHVCGMYNNGIHPTEHVPPIVEIDHASPNVKSTHFTSIGEVEKIRPFPFMMVRSAPKNEHLEVHYSTTTPTWHSQDVKYRILNKQAVITALENEIDGEKAITALKIDTDLWLVVDQTSETLNKISKHWYNWNAKVGLRGTQSSEISDLINRLCNQQLAA